MMIFTELFNQLTSEELENYHKSVFMNMEGEAAEKARCLYYKQALRSMGENVKIGRSVTIINPQYISIGANVTIHDNCTLIAKGEAGISLDDNVTLKDRVYLDTESGDGYIKIGKAVYIGAGCTLHGHMGLEIMDDCLLAQNITITPYSHISDDCTRLIKDQGGHSRKVTIEKDCYIGMCCCILYGADIHEGSVVGSGSVVVRSIPPYSIAVGVPAKVIRKRGAKHSSTTEKTALE